MECTLCLCLPCKCEWRRRYYCLLFDSIVEIRSDHFWLLTIDKQIQQVTIWINGRKSDLCHVLKNAQEYAVAGQPLPAQAKKLVRLIEHSLKELEELLKLMIQNDKT